MAEKFYRLLFGMKQHPQTFRERGIKPLPPYKPDMDDEYQMLFAGDVFKVEENLIMRPGPLGGWVEQTKDGGYVLAIAEEVKDAQREAFTTRDEPSKVIGINISEADYARNDRAEEARSSVVHPLQPVAVGAPESVKKPSSTPRVRK